MKKHGFTLAELLITLGIIGVAAALVVPAVTHMMPDQDKTLLMKKYNNLVEITNNLLDNKQIYYTPMEKDGKTPTCIGLGCSGLPLVSSYNDNSVADFYKGVNKYPYLVADMMGVKNTDITKTSLGENAYKYEFKTADGTQYEIRSALINSQNDPPTTLLSTVWIKLPNSNGNGLYSNENPKPGTYGFEINSKGRISPYDHMSLAYFLNPFKMNDKNTDRTNASSIYAKYKNINDAINAVRESIIAEHTAKTITEDGEKYCYIKGVKVKCNIGTLFPPKVEINPPIVFTPVSGDEDDEDNNNGPDINYVGEIGSGGGCSPQLSTDPLRNDDINVNKPYEYVTTITTGYICAY